VGRFPGLYRYPDLRRPPLKSWNAPRSAADELARRKNVRVRFATGQEARTIWRIHRLHRLPKCKFIRSEDSRIKCLKCETGELVERVAKKGAARLLRLNKYPRAISRRPFANPRAVPEVRAPFIVEKRGKMGAIRACFERRL